jgi:ABC-type anion transport system duplicated permease subunit
MRPLPFCLSKFFNVFFFSTLYFAHFLNAWMQLTNFPKLIFEAAKSLNTHLWLMHRVLRTWEQNWRKG